MPKIDYDNSGIEREYEATTYTLLIYEHAFKGDLIKEVFGRIDLRHYDTLTDDEGNIVIADYTAENWLAELRAFWAMLKTSEEICKREKRTCLPVPSFEEWCIVTRNPDLQEISRATITELNRGLFRAGAA